MQPSPSLAHAQRRPSFARALFAVVWERRWKLATTILAYVLARACEYAPEWAQPACELAAQIAKVLP